MSKAMQELFEDARNEVKIETNTINLRSIMVNLNLNADQAMDALSIDEKDRDFYREKLAALSKNQMDKATIVAFCSLDL